MRVAQATMPAKKIRSVQVSSKKQIAEPPTAPGSASNFTGLPEDDNAIPVTTAVSSTQMQVNLIIVNVVSFSVCKLQVLFLTYTAAEVKAGVHS